MLPGKRVFDVAIEGVPVIQALDLAREAGPNTAVSRQFTVKVVDGHLDVTFHERVGNPILSFIRISERPDRTVS
ncbi:malectin domain-containing carbohydrate-binding protein [Nonomuraea sp. 10N515B]|uniref:malectin domain-containing carbohydrate-binding protein n=1 Tax=Nonomuraea sp. 10N515B TaxID=3457422 RepID=UPI003FCE8655